MRVSVPKISGVVRAFDYMDPHRGTLPEGRADQCRSASPSLRGPSLADRDDQHGGFGRRDHASDRVDGQLMHGGGARRPNVDPLQLVFGRDPALDQFGQTT